MLRYYCTSCSANRRLWVVPKSVDAPRQRQLQTHLQHITSKMSTSALSPSSSSSYLLPCSTNYQTSYHQLMISVVKKDPHQSSQTRLFSHGTSHNIQNATEQQQQQLPQQLQKLPAITKSILNAPLGTLTTVQIETGMNAIQSWLTIPEDDKDESLSSKTFNTYFADQLLQRLVSEHATKTLAIQQFTNTLSEMNVIMLDKLISLGSIPMTLKRAEIVLFRIINWHNSISCGNKTTARDNDSSSSLLPLPKPEDLPTLVTLWLDQNSNEGMIHALDLLLQSTTHKHIISMPIPDSVEKPRSSTTITTTSSTTTINNEFWIAPDLLIPLFHQLHHSMVMNMTTNDNDRIQNLISRMEQLSNEYGWVGIQPHTVNIDTSKPIIEAIDGGLEGQTTLSSVSDDAMTVEGGLSPFELEALQLRFVDFAKGATIKDAGKVEEFGKRLLMANNNNSQQQTQQNVQLNETYQHLVDYYIRMGDPKMASQWLRQMDQATESKSKLPFDSFMNVLQLWSQSSHKEQYKEAPWRAQELFRRMEELEHHGVFTLDAHAYNLLAESWANSKEVSAAQKVGDIFLRMMEAGTKHQRKTPNLATFEIVSRTGPPKGGGAILDKYIEAACHVLDQYQNNKDDKQGDKQGDMQSFLCKIIHYLSQVGTQGASIDKLILDAVNKQIPMSTDICESVINAHVTSRKPMSALNALVYFENIEKESDSKILSFDCYKGTSLSLVASGKKGTFEQEKGLMSHIVDRVIKKDLSVPPSSTEFTNFLETVLFKMMSQRRSFDAEKVLNLLEGKILSQVESSADLSVACFNAIIRAWAQANNLDRTGKTFRRLFNHYQAGHSQLMPNTASFSMYISLLSKRKDLKDAATKAEEILKEMIELHKITGRDECKPDEGIFNAVLISWNQSGGHVSVTHSIAILDQMEELNVSPDTFSFNTVMRTVVQDDRKDAYKKVMELKDRMTSLGLEPNLNIFNIILNACAAAKSSDSDSALGTALYTLGRIRDNGANIVTYTTLTKAFRNLLRSNIETRDKVAGSAFKMCCVDGFLSADLEKQFRQLLSDMAWAELYSKPVNSNGSVPVEWRRNLKAN